MNEYDGPLGFPSGFTDVYPGAIYSNDGKRITFDLHYTLVDDTTITLDSVNAKLENNDLLILYILAANLDIKYQKWSNDEEKLLADIRNHLKQMKTIHYSFITENNVYVKYQYDPPHQ